MTVRVKISWDQGTTFERECWLDDTICKTWDREEYDRARAELERCGRCWIGGGAHPFALLIKVQP